MHCLADLPEKLDDCFTVNVFVALGRHPEALGLLFAKTLQCIRY
jgi:hypothetical protein